MTKECVFRVEVEGMLWRVVKYPKTNCYGAHLYKIEQNRRVYSKQYRMCANLVIEECLMVALRCSVKVAWRIAL